MSHSVIFAYPGELGTPTGGYGYDRRVIAGLGDLGWTVEPLSLGAGFPDPDPQQLQEAERKLDALPDGTLVIIDGLAFGVMDRWAERNAQRLTIIALVHHPLAMETGLDAASQQRLREAETGALDHAIGVITTSETTARLVADFYAVPADKLLVAVPGVQPAALATGTHETPHILSVGSLTRRKGHDILISALEKIADLEWTCRIVGSADLDRGTADALRHQLSASTISDRVELAGAVDDIRGDFVRTDIFALATRYEGYGMVFAEAMVHGLPIVGCRVGAVADVVPDNAGFLVEADDPDAFAGALRRLLEDTELRISMADAAAVAGSKLPSWHDTAARISDFLKACHGL
ncbi:Glycosyl transferases group 1 [Rhizobium sp. NFR07]|uniref:glycosyltransferase family 4 protein n=1 Tax=Rhizobium sp. NFR07 TaxID=1566262 RepID=UPI0008EE0826|nr:glycosyltransferase family 4 protein [Rhizobium sp. NFR07]SFB53985.1 Glycosyl transferases group 1 [Rhizobium sp. NFR07]